ncbi:hypothetical protein [Methylomonas sp. DH-1]|uniref:hypothetical protein n=1 Tax=Methylomonas sp. (strain DH-1) TaxID=1727196 RepID=UPI000AD57030|nr:hypothetical protein [Methylomonas sp. DH-1]
MATLTPRSYRPALAAALIFSTAATASFVNTSPLIASSRSSRNVDNGYAGLKWTLGESFIPELVVGFRHANVGSNGETYGGDISFSFRVWGGLQPGQIRLKYFNGADYLQGEVGGGYDFKNGFFVGLGGKAPFSSVGLDYQFSGRVPLVPYFMLDSIGQYRKPAVNFRITCPLPGQHYNPVTGLCGGII